MGTNGVAVEAIAETLKGEDYHQQLSSLSPCTRGIDYAPINVKPHLPPLGHGSGWGRVGH